MTDNNSEVRLAEFLAKFTPEIEARAGAIITSMRQRLPGAFIHVYDNYNALAVGFGATDRVSDLIFSIAVFPHWVSLFFAHGVKLDDAARMLKGSGSRFRHVVLASPERLDDPAIQHLMTQALRIAAKPIDPLATGGLVIKSISAKQRPRRP